MAPRRKLTCGWCRSGLHARCPRIMQAERITPKGSPRREIRCSCEHQTAP